MKKLLIPALMVLLAVGSIIFTACEGVSGTEDDDLLADVYGFVLCDEGYTVSGATVTLYYSENEGSSWYSASSGTTDVCGYFTLDDDGWRDHYGNGDWYKIVATKGGYTGLVGNGPMPKNLPTCYIQLDGCPHPYPHGGP